MAVNWVQNPYQPRGVTPFMQPEEQYDTSGSSWFGGVGQADQQAPDVGSIFAPASPGDAIGGGAALLGGGSGGLPDNNAQPMDYPSEDAIARRRKLAEALMGKQMEVNHPMQAIANAVSQISGAWMNKKADDDQKKYEQHRRDVYQKSFDEAGGDLDKLMASWMKSGDPDLVDKAYDYQLKKMVASQQGGDAPEIKTIYDGNNVYSAQWDAKSRQWVPLGAPSPRWKQGGGGGGGGGWSGVEGEGGGGGGGFNGAPTAMGSDFILADGTRVAAPFQKGRGFIYRDPKTGAWKDIPPDAQRVTATMGGFVTPTQWIKLKSDWQNERNGLDALDRYFKTVKDIPTGVNRWALDVSAKFKTFMGQTGLTPDQFNLMDASAQAQALLGLFRTTIVGPGVMTEYDAVRVLQALGGNPASSLQNPAIMERVLSGLYERKRAQWQNLDEEVRRNAPAYGFDYGGTSAPPMTLGGDATGGQSGASPAPSAPSQRPVLKPVNQRKVGDTMEYNGSTYVWNGKGWVVQ